MRPSGILCHTLTAVSGLVAVAHAYRFEADYEGYGLARRDFLDDEHEEYLGRRSYLDDDDYVGYLDRRTLDLVQEHFHLIPRTKPDPSKPFDNKHSNVDRVRDGRRTGLGTGEGATGFADLHGNILAGHKNKQWTDAKVSAQQKGFLQQQNHGDGMRSKTDAMLDINKGNTWV